MNKARIAVIALMLVAVGAVAAYLAYANGLFGRAGSVAAQSIPSDSGEMSANQLAMGTLVLEETDLAVTPEQAAKLVPLWQMLSALYGSTNAAQDEIDAVVRQLRNTMTEEQLEAIRGRETGAQDMASVMESLGIDLQRPEVEGTPGARLGQAGVEGQAPQWAGGGMGRGAAGGVPAGTDFAGGQTAFAEADVAAMRATRQASGDTGGGFMMGRANTAIVERLIEVLQEWAAEASAGH